MQTKLGSSITSGSLLSAKTGLASLMQAGSILRWFRTLLKDFPAKRGLVPTLVLLLATLPGASPALAQTVPLRLFHAIHPAMGSEFVIDVYAPDEQTVGQWTQTAFKEIDRIEDVLSNYRPSSELSRINVPPLLPLEVSPYITIPGRTMTMSRLCSATREVGGSSLVRSRRMPSRETSCGFTERRAVSISHLKMQSSITSPDTLH
jgi:hypothetical protein